MKFAVLVSLLASGLVTAASWSFDDASLQVLENRGSEVSSKKKLSAEAPLRDSITIRSSGLLRFALTVTNGGKPRRPHQAFVTISSANSQLAESFPLTLNDAGKGKLDIKYSDIPTALTASNEPLLASIVIGSFGTSKSLKASVFSFSTPGQPSGTQSASPRYSAMPEINHIFREDARSPAKIITLTFTLAVLTALPVLLIAWAALGANLAHAGKAFGAAPVSHALFFGSIVAMELAFWQYYTSWRLFTLLPVAGIIGLVAFVSGSRALTEVQQRRLNGDR